MSQQGPAPGRSLLHRRLRALGAAIALLAAVVLVPLVRVLGSDGAAALAPASYLPQRAAEVLTYRLGGSLRATVELRVGSRGTIAGVPTLSLEQLAAPASTILPFGLSGGTVRVEGDTVVRTAEGGTVRDLVGPVAPGRRWSDVRHTAAAGGAGSTFTVTEDRTLLGPSSLDEPYGHLERCLVVAVASNAVSAGGAVAAAGATLWYCEGVGLARAVLRGGGAGDTVDLVAVRGA
jgi:hypothetical protein